MKLLKFPYLINKMILDEMTPLERVSLSKLSNKAKRLLNIVSDFRGIETMEISVEPEHLEMQLSSSRVPSIEDVIVRTSAVDGVFVFEKNSPAPCLHYPMRSWFLKDYLPMIHLQSLIFIIRSDVEPTSIIRSILPYVQGSGLSVLVAGPTQDHASIAHALLNEKNVASVKIELTGTDEGTLTQRLRCSHSEEDDEGLLDVGGRLFVISGVVEESFLHIEAVEE